MIHDEIGEFVELTDPNSVNPVIHDEIGLSQSFFAVHGNSPVFPVFTVFLDFLGVAECDVDPALSELSAHPMARPGHFHTQAYRSIFSQACDHRAKPLHAGLHGKSELCMPGGG